MVGTLLYFNVQHINFDILIITFRSAEALIFNNTAAIFELYQ